METPFRYSTPDELKRLISGENETVFQLLESRFCVVIQSRTPDFLHIIPKENADLEGVVTILDQLKIAAKHKTPITTEWVSQMLSISPNESSSSPKFKGKMIMRNRFGVTVYARTQAQALLAEASEKNDILFANGPAGTGKTFLAVALAVSALERKEVERICLVRPAVEAGESLGFLPGDLKEKIAPYLRPIHDSLAELLPAEKLNRYQENGAIEVAPLAYMRGRTLKRAFIILDEAQNTTIAQMKMFLTRLGPSSKAIITGDATQIDLAPKEPSGFLHAMQLLKGIRGITQIDFAPEDVLRHRLVKEIIAAYTDKGKDYEKK